MEIKTYAKETYEKYQKSYAWKTAIGLQLVDNLKPSEYLYEVANKTIEENLSYDEANKLINDYYEAKTTRDKDSYEADKVSIKIAELITARSFVLSPIEYINIHKRSEKRKWEKSSEKSGYA